MIRSPVAKMKKLKNGEDRKKRKGKKNYLKIEKKIG